METYGRGRRCGQSPPETFTHLPGVSGGPFFLFRHRKKSSVTDSFSSLVHRPTMDQFTEGVASRLSSQPRWPQAAQFQAPGGAGRSSYPLGSLRAEPRPDAGTHMGQTLGLLTSGSQMNGKSHLLRTWKSGKDKAVIRSMCFVPQAGVGLALWMSLGFLV